ncbi:MAG TPA: hypothetical protein VNB90_14895 [Cytophagaceae bacterium]|nr:hypothetical protein [Cytophagaceae bacterium]
MKSLFLSVLFLVVANVFVFAQTNPSTATSVELPTFNVLQSADYLIKAEIIGPYKYKYTIMKNNDDSSTQTFILSPNTEQAFRLNFIKYFKLVAGDDTIELTNTSDSKKVDSTLGNEADRLFYVYTVSSVTYATVHDVPTAGKIYFRDTVNIERVFYSNRDSYRKYRHFKRIVKGKEQIEKGEDPQDYAGYDKLKYRSAVEIPKTWKKKLKETLKYNLSQKVKMKEDSLNDFNRLFNDSLNTCDMKTKILQATIDSLVKKKKSTDALNDTCRKYIENFNKKYPNFLLIKYSNYSLPDRIRATGYKIETAISELQDKETKIEKDTIMVDSAKKKQITTLEDSIKAIYIVADSLNSIINLYNRITKIASDNTALDVLIKEKRDSTVLLQKQIQEYQNQKTLLTKEYIRIDRERISYTFKITELEIEFNDGFIENIVVIGTLTDTVKSKFLKFNNQYPIGFSRKWDYWKYKDSYLLYAKGPDGEVYTMDVRNVISDYIEKLEVDRRDYSPQDTVMNFKFSNNVEKSMTLTKENTYKLFEAKVYSDFVGLNDNNPNGLVQTEISRKVNLITYRFIWFERRNLNMKVSFGGYIKPEIVLSKIEKNNKNLLLDYKDRVIDNQYTPLKYTSTLKLRQYENFNAGFDFNLTTWDIPSFKSLFYIDAGFRYGRTSITDSVRRYQNNQIVHTEVANNFGVNTVRFYPKVTWEIKSDERYCFNFSYSHVWYYLRDNSFTQVANLESYNTNSEKGTTSKQYNQVALLATFNPNRSAPSKGKLFFRYQLYWQQGYWNTTFEQAQVGYSFFLLSHK